MQLQWSLSRDAWRRGATAACACLLLGCGASPQVLVPPLAATAVPAAFREVPPSHPEPMPAPADWRAFADPALQAWLAHALAHSPTLAQVAARVDRAAAVLGSQAAAARPHLDAQFAATRRDGPLVNDAGDRGNLFQAGLTLRWDADLFDRLSRQQQAALQDVQAQRAALEQARLALQADISQAYLAWRLARIEGGVMEALLRVDEALAAAARRRVQAGLAPAAHQEAALAEWQADATARQGVMRREAQLSHALLALAGGETPADIPTTTATATPGRSPGPATPTAVVRAAMPTLPAVPPGLPSRMLQRRPDIAAAEARLQAARLRLGLARDAWFPALTLTAQAGLASGELGQWLQATARNTGLGLLLALPLFDGGRRDAEEAAAQAQLAEAAAAHRAQVVAALREVDDQLAALRTQGEAARLLADGVELALQAQARAHRQWRDGLLPATDAWQASRVALRQQRLWIQAEAARSDATVALVHALGGSWDVAAADTGRVN